MIITGGVALEAAGLYIAMFPVRTICYNIKTPNFANKMCQFA
jgi:hypothetical protein